MEKIKSAMILFYTNRSYLFSMRIIKKMKNIITRTLQSIIAFSTQNQEIYRNVNKIDRLMLKYTSWTTILVFFILSSCGALHEGIDNHFSSEKEYHFRAIYIDEKGDTITNEIVEMNPLDRRWVGQPSVQEAVKYTYNTNPNDYDQFKSPMPYIYESNLSNLEKDGHLKIQSSEKTGAYFNGQAYFLHPPRTNQYHMLRYAAYPKMEFECLTDSTTSFYFIQRPLGEVKYQHHYIVTPLKDSLTFCNTTKTKAWKVQTTSEVTGLSEYWQKLRIHSSTCEAIFSKELGFVKMHHTFENGIKIQFDLIKVVGV